MCEHGFKLKLLKVVCKNLNMKPQMSTYTRKVILVDLMRCPFFRLRLRFLGCEVMQIQKRNSPQGSVSRSTLHASSASWSGLFRGLMGPSVKPAFALDLGRFCEICWTLSKLKQHETTMGCSKVSVGYSWPRLTLWEDGFSMSQLSYFAGWPNQHLMRTNSGWTMSTSMPLSWPSQWQWNGWSGGVLRAWLRHDSRSGWRNTPIRVISDIENHKGKSSWITCLYIIYIHKNDDKCVCASFDSKLPELSFHGGMFVALGGFSLRLLWLLHDSPSYFQRQNRRMCPGAGHSGPI
jgi:hypothetical protein